jgi:hypothetical protein
LVASTCNFRVQEGKISLIPKQSTLSIIEAPATTVKAPFDSLRNVPSTKVRAIG